VILRRFSEHVKARDWTAVKRTQTSFALMRRMTSIGDELPDAENRSVSATGGYLPLDVQVFCQTSNDPLDPVRGTIAGRIQQLYARVKLKLKRKSFTSTEAINQLAPNGGIIRFSQHYAAKRRETPSQLGPHWDPVQFLVFFADPQGS